LSEHFGIELNSQIFDAAIGMHGAGGYQAQCGLVEGALLFFGIIARAKGVPDPMTIVFFAEGWLKHFLQVMELWSARIFGLKDSNQRIRHTCAKR
jgi:hypothetical protein